ncbi:hypothetical protein EVA_18184 [gut metagenome]|uniref:Uncharacterized protein n=1 Tax=gut metagenome TaxID=749906 RepID=J9G2C9_9ZZZZ
MSLCLNKEFLLSAKNHKVCGLLLHYQRDGIYAPLF